MAGNGIPKAKFVPRDVRNPSDRVESVRRANIVKRRRPVASTLPPGFFAKPAEGLGLVRSHRRSSRLSPAWILSTCRRRPPVPSSPSFPDRLTAPYFPRSHDRPRFRLASLASIGFHVSFRQVDPARFRRLCAFRATPFPRPLSRCVADRRATYTYVSIYGKKMLCRVLSFSWYYRRFLIPVVFFFIGDFSLFLFICVRSWITDSWEIWEVRECTEEWGKSIR